MFGSGPREEQGSQGTLNSSVLFFSPAIRRHCGRHRRDRAGSEGGERTGSAAASAEEPRLLETLCDDSAGLLGWEHAPNDVGREPGKGDSPH